MSSSRRSTSSLLSSPDPHNSGDLLRHLACSPSRKVRLLLEALEQNHVRPKATLPSGANIAPLHVSRLAFRSDGPLCRDTRRVASASEGPCALVPGCGS